MNKTISKTKIVLLSLAVFVSVGWIGLKAVGATGAIDIVELFRPLNILGVSVQAGQTAKLVLIDTGIASSSQSYTLPSTSGRDGEWYIVHTHGGGPSAFVYTASGDTFEDDAGAVFDTGTWTEYEITGDIGGYLSVIADEDNNTWWAVGSGNANYSYFNP